MGTSIELVYLYTNDIGKVSDTTVLFYGHRTWTQGTSIKGSWGGPSKISSICRYVCLGVCPLNSLLYPVTHPTLVRSHRLKLPPRAPVPAPAEERPL